MAEEKEFKFKCRFNDEEREFIVERNLKGWVIVNEVGNGRWLGKLSSYDKEKYRATLEYGLELASPGRIPVMVMKSGGVQGGVQSGFDCDFTLQIDSLHPINDIAVSHMIYSEDMSDALRNWCFNILARAMLGPRDASGKRRRIQA